MMAPTPIEYRLCSAIQTESAIDSDGRRQIQLAYWYRVRGKEHFSKLLAEPVEGRDYEAMRRRNCERRVEEVDTMEL